MSGCESDEYDDWGNGYRQGQHDVIGVLEGYYGIRAIANSAFDRFCLWCLGHNLAVAGGLDYAARQGLKKGREEVGAQVWQQLMLPFAERMR